MSVQAEAVAAPALVLNGEDLLYEVVNGLRVEKPMGAFQVLVASILFEFLGPFARTQKLGRVVTEMLFRINPATKLERRPDLAYVSFERWPRNRPVSDANAWDVVPDLAVEVVSKTNLAEAEREKIIEYFQAGVKLVWVIYPKTREVYVYDAVNRAHILNDRAELDGGTVLPGFRLPVAALFEEEVA